MQGAYCPKKDDGRLIMVSNARKDAKVETTEGYSALCLVKCNVNIMSAEDDYLNMPCYKPQTERQLRLGVCSLFRA